MMASRAMPSQSSIRAMRRDISCSLWCGRGTGRVPVPQPLGGWCRIIPRPWREAGRAIRHSRVCRRRRRSASRNGSVSISAMTTPWASQVGLDLVERVLVP